jgi:hypothetical protein
MPDDRSLEYRASAAECLRLAARTTDPVRRTEYLALAQVWKDLANEVIQGKSALDRAERAFNDRQMRKGGKTAQPAQQQQQIQPNKKGK